MDNFKDLDFEEIAARFCPVSITAHYIDTHCKALD